MPDETNDSAANPHSQFLSLALERYKLCTEAENASRAESLDDLQFSVGEQWPKDIMDDRNADGRPCLTINRLPQFIRNVCNEQRQQRPAAQINPVGDGADPELAEIIQGIVRHIEVNSDAEVAYDHAFEMMVRIGFGWWRILTDYVKDGSKEQEIFIKRIRNPFKVYLDPLTEEPDYSDARFGFITCDMAVEEYKAEYKDSKLAALTEFTSIGDKAPNWVAKDYIRVAEYFYAERKSKFERAVKWAKINAIETIEGPKDIPGSYIPLVKVVGDELDVDGTKHLAGLVRHAKDPQRQYNYWQSAATETIALAPKAQFLADATMIEDYEEEWRQMNRRNLAILKYKASSTNPQAPPPARIDKEPAIQGMATMMQIAAENLQATTGLNDANLGKSKPDESGKAILARQKQGDLGTLNFSDNLARSIRHSTRIILSMVPHVYDTPRIQRIIKPDQSVSHVVIHNGDDQKVEASKLRTDKIQKIYDVSVGRYDVTVSVGPSYQTKRQEAVASQLELLKILPPQVAQSIMDIVVSNMDMPGHQAIADRLRKQLPPNLLDDDSMDPDQKIQVLQAKLQQLMQQHEIMTKALNDATRMIDTKQIEAKNKMDLAELQERTKILVAEINTKAQEAATRMKMEHEQWLALHGSAHDVGMEAEKAKNAQDLAAQNAAAQQNLAVTNAALQPQPQNGTGGQP